MPWTMTTISSNLPRSPVMTSTRAEDDPLVSSAARKAARGTIATLLLRILSFLCTQYTLRVLDPSTLGQASIQLELLLSSSVLFVSREGFRLAITHSKSSGTTNSNNYDAASWNVAWLSVPTTIIASLAMLMWHLYRAHADHVDYKWAGILYCIASCIEGCGEPCVLWALQDLNIATKVSAEGLATLSKTFATVLLLQQMQENWPISAIAAAQVIYALVYTIYLYSKVGKNLKMPVFGLVDTTTLYMTFVFTLQSLFKHFLTEGDRIVLANVSSNYHQGVYAMASSYGGLAARLLLQPLEENGRLMWSRIAASSSMNSTEPTKQKQQTGKDKNDSNKQDFTSSTIMLRTSYVVLVKIVMYIGLVFSCIAVNYTSILLNVMAGRRWGKHSEASLVLSAFCVYTAFLALNGMTEAFVYGVTNTGRQIWQLSLVHTGIGILFAVLAPWAVSNYGTVGLVVVNCVAMALRSIYSIIFAARYFTTESQSTVSNLQHLTKDMLPKRTVLFAFFVAYYVTHLSLRQMNKNVQEFGVETGTGSWYYLATQHISVGVTCAIGIGAIAYALEQEFRSSIKKLWHSKQD